MLQQHPQHADCPAPNRQRIGASEENFYRSIKAEGAESVDRIHADPDLN
jgi:hypothetical protein